MLFGPAHLACLGILLLAVAAVILLRRRFSPRARRLFRYGLAGLLIANEVSTHLWHAWVQQWSVQYMLPLHLCSVFSWLTAVMLLTRSYRIYEFAYFLGIGGAVQALITPHPGFGFPHYRFFQSYFAHAPIVLGTVYMTVVEGYRPTLRSLLRVAVAIHLYMLPVFALNLLLGSNYLFINRKPAEPTLLDYLGPWPWYILGMEAVGLFTCLLLYLPLALSDRASLGLRTSGGRR
ncbi:MAG: TIGR02206 family membrane protein [Chloroflexia bacterium]